MAAKRNRPPRQAYWALLATPRVYRLQERLADPAPDDLWTTKGRSICRGDKVVIWQGSGGRRGAPRGVVALGEVTADPAVISDVKNSDWVDSADSQIPQERVQVRYTHRFPRPMTADDDPVIGDLSVGRATGGTVFHVTPEQWDALLALASRHGHQVC